MFGLTLVVASIALADSINPSTVVPAIWLARRPAWSGLASYTLGVFAVYLAGGLVLLLGPGRVLIASLHHIHGPVEHALQAAGGIVVLGLGLVAWRSRRNPPNQPPTGRLHTRASAFALGAAIMAVELPTAFMYFGAISAVLAAHPTAPAEISLLVVYNALFVAPLIVILAIRRLAGARADRWIASAERRMRYGGQVALAGVAGIGGAVLAVIGVRGLLVA